MLTMMMPALLVGFLLSELLTSDADDEDSDDLSAGGGDGSSPDNPGGFISGTNGDDILRGDDGDDRILGAGGNDTIYAEGGNDNVGPGPDNDEVYLGAGNDSSVTETEGDDVIFGGVGNDIISDTRGANLLYGDDGDDRLVTTDTGRGFTPDESDGGAGDDVLIGDMGDQMTGGDGVDTFEVRAHSLANGPALITDAQPGETFRVVVPEAFADETLTYAATADGSGTEVSFRGTVLVVLQGVTEAGDVQIDFAFDRQAV